jgi:hypothetical protein
VKKILTAINQLRLTRIDLDTHVTDNFQVTPISIDDPDRNLSIIKNNLMRELCERDRHARKNRMPTEFLLVDIWESSLGGFEVKYLESRIKEIEESSYIKLLPNGKITLTDSGRKLCSQFLNFK